jgi:hypothetical protein
MENLLEIFYKKKSFEKLTAFLHNLYKPRSFGDWRRGAENYKHTWVPLQAWELGNKTDPPTTFLFFFSKAHLQELN